VKRPTILPINSQADYEKKHGIPPDQYDEPDNFKSRLSEPPNPVDATPDTPTGIAERGRKLIAFSEIRETVRLDIIHYRPNKTDDKILAYLGESEEPTAKLMALYITNTIEDVIANSAPDALADHYKLLVIGADRLEIWGDQYRRLHNNPSLYRLIPQDVVDMFEDMGLFTKQRYMGHVVAEAMRSAADKVLHHLTGLRMAGQY
jgi:hypothetical protein